MNDCVCASRERVTCARRDLNRRTLQGNSLPLPQRMLLSLQVLPWRHCPTNSRWEGCSCRDLRAYGFIVPYPSGWLDPLQLPALPLTIETVEIDILLITVVFCELIKRWVHRFHTIATFGVILWLWFSVTFWHHKTFSVTDVLPVLIS